MLSKFHSNRQGYNWLVYDINDKFLMKYSPYYKGTLYDLGCGTSPYKDFFLKYVHKYVGVDWGSTLHETKPEIEADLNKPLLIQDDVADTIISLSVMEHLCEPQMMLNEAFRILKKEGTIILQVPFQWHIHEAPYDFYRYTPYGLEYMFKKAGFTIVEITPSSGFFTTFFIKLNYFSTRLIRGGRITQNVVEFLLKPFWYINQKLAIFLDRFDKRWSEETQGYWVIAKK
jgi:SAM-dependent methyltransferase